MSWIYFLSELSQFNSCCYSYTLANEMQAHKHMHTRNSLDARPCYKDRQVHAQMQIHMPLTFAAVRREAVWSSSVTLMNMCRAADIRLKKRKDTSQPSENTLNTWRALVCVVKGRGGPAGWHCCMHVWTGLVQWRAWLHLSEGEAQAQMRHPCQRSHALCKSHYLGVNCAPATAVPIWLHRAPCFIAYFLTVKGQKCS